MRIVSINYLLENTDVNVFFEMTEQVYREMDHDGTPQEIEDYLLENSDGIWNFHLVENKDRVVEHIYEHTDFILIYPK